MSKLNIQIFVNPNDLNRLLESWFVQNIIFNGAPFSLFKPFPHFSNVGVYLALGDLDLNFLDDIKGKSRKLVLYHMGDERCQINIDNYNFFDLILRNYYDKDLFIKCFNKKLNVMWVPNGFRTGVGPKSSIRKPSSLRGKISGFLGWTTNSNSYNKERIEFKKIYENIPDIFLLNTNGFSSGVNVDCYSSIMEDIVLSPCPAGNSAETIRLYDSLECGCIPIMLKHEFLFSTDALARFGEVPFPLINSWSELPKTIHDFKMMLISDPTKIDRLQEYINCWWTRFKFETSRNVTENINDLN